MRDFLLYFASFLVLLTLQEFILGSVDLFYIISPFIYIMIIVMLPMQLKSIPTLICSMLVGVVMDMFMGTSALCTISLVFTGYVREWIIKLTIPLELTKQGGVPFVNRIGLVPFLKYTTTISLLFALVYFNVEMMSVEMIGYTMLRAILSTICTVLLIWLLQSLVSGKVKKMY